MKEEYLSTKLNKVLCQFGMDTTVWAEAISDFKGKLSCLAHSNNYDKLLKALFSSKELNEFNSYVFEVQFAYDFQSKGHQLSYEVKRLAGGKSSIDFCYKLSGDKKIYFELRLIRQKEWITKFTDSQIKHKGYFQIELNGDDEKSDTIRLQNIILSKCQDSKGKPIKFSKGVEDINFIVVNLSELYLNMPDKNDCLLAMYGDSKVPMYCRRGIFGLWQELDQSASDEEKTFIRKFEHIRNAIHGAIFVKYAKDIGHLARMFIDRELEYYLIGNNNLLPKAEFDSIFEKLKTFLRGWG